MHFQASRARRFSSVSEEDVDLHAFLISGEILLQTSDFSDGCVSSENALIFLTLSPSKGRGAARKNDTEGRGMRDFWLFQITQR